MRTCFLIGTGNAPDKLYQTLQMELERHIVECGVQNFLVGHLGNYDRLATSALRQLKYKYPKIILTMLLPFHPVEEPVEKPEWFDMMFHPTEMYRVPPELRISELDYWAVDLSEFVIAYTDGTEARADAILEYAMRTGAKVTTLSEIDE